MVPDLAAVLQVGPHESREEGWNHLPHPPGHSSFDEAQYTVGPPGCKNLSVCQMRCVAVMRFRVQESWKCFGFYQWSFLSSFLPPTFIFWAKEFKAHEYIPHELLKALRVQLLAIFFFLLLCPLAEFWSCCEGVNVTDSGCGVRHFGEVFLSWNKH